MPAKPTVRAKRQKARTARRRRLVTERERLAALVEAAIARMDQIDGDDDMEADNDDEDSGDGHPHSLGGGSRLGPGDAVDGEENGDEEFDPSDEAQLETWDDEPSHNYPVTETTLGQAAWRPTPQELALPPIPELVLREQPEGYVAIRVFRS